MLTVICDGKRIEVDSHRTEQAVLAVLIESDFIESIQRGRLEMHFTDDEVKVHTGAVTTGKELREKIKHLTR